MEQEITYHTCSKCGEEKPLTSEYFYKNSTKKIGFKYECKDCSKIRSRKRYKKIQIQKPQPDRTIKEKKCKTCNQVKSIDNFGFKPTNKGGYQHTCKSCRLKYEYEWNLKNPERKKINAKTYRDKESSKKNMRDYRRKYMRDKLRNDKVFNLLNRFRCRLRESIINKGFSKRSKTKEYIGCNSETFMKHLENQFVGGMSWHNQSEWHLDHYYPVSLAQTEKDMYIFNHYTNFRPLWAKDNLSKSNRVPDGFEEWYDMMRKKIL